MPYKLFINWCFTLKPRSKNVKKTALLSCATDIAMGVKELIRVTLMSFLVIFQLPDGWSGHWVPHCL